MKFLWLALLLSGCCCCPRNEPLRSIAPQDLSSQLDNATPEHHVTLTPVQCHELVCW